MNKALCNVDHAVTYVMLDKVKFLSSVVCLYGVKHAIMVHKCFEAIAMTIEPIDHVSTIRCTQTSNTITIQKVIGFKHIIKSLFKIMIRMSSPMMLNWISECLTITYTTIVRFDIFILSFFSLTSRSMRIDKDGYITSTSKHLGIPTSRPISYLSTCNSPNQAILTKNLPMHLEDHHGLRMRQDTFW